MLSRPPFSCNIVALVILCASVDAIAATPLAPLPTQAMVDKAEPALLRKLATNERTEFFVVLREQADLTSASTLVTREEKSRHVFEKLRATADQTQPPIRKWLEAGGIAHQPFWIANTILIDGNLDIAVLLAERDDIARLVDNPQVRMESPALSSPLKATTAIEWGISKIRAHEVWSAGFTGQGIVVASADTGADWTHPALKSKYRGWDGVNASHDYNWHDAIHGFNARCPANSPEPCDDGLHGTHTVGTMVGDDGAGNQVGVAPGAKWIGCRNMNNGVGTPATYTECFQFFLAPTTVGGANPDPSKSPHVINNSWGCPPSEGCTDVLVLKMVTENLQSAGIIVVTSAGNSGPSCRSVVDPIAIYNASISVGATNVDDIIATFSSRGPVAVDGSNRRKPDLSAPGVAVRSTIPNGGYQTLQGTSMASPHVAGAVALLLSARPQLRGQPGAVRQALEGSAVPRPSSICDTSGAPDVPNNTYGWGRLDVKAALDAAPPLTLDIDASAPSTSYDALTDGLLTIRYMFGLRGPELTAGTVGRTARRVDPLAITAYLDSMGGALDIDGDGRIDALTDGVLIIRYLFGLHGARLSDNAVAINATRPTAELIENYLRSLTP